MTARRVLITGASGFVGSHIANYFQKAGWVVSVLARASSQLVLSPEVAIHIYDGSYGSVLAALQEKRKVDLVIHLAAKVATQHSPHDIDNIFDSNILFGAQLLEAMNELVIRRFINTGTSWQHFSGDSYDPVCLYAATKQAFESIIDFYVNAKSFKVITLKLFDNYGAKDSRRKIIGLLTDSLICGKTLAMSGGEQTIDLVHIADICNAYSMSADLLMANANVGHQRYSVSSKLPISLRDLVEVFERVSGRKLSVEFGARPYREREVMKVWEGGEWVPGWRPSVDLEVGLKEWMTEALKDKSYHAGLKE